ncbi:MAG: hypothetical protein KA035_00040 [Candidatus Levybacteria bacterium]|nr:hypothetical protein [Candidatus Levybacteria bacterium]
MKEDFLLRTLLRRMRPNATAPFTFTVVGITGPPAWHQYGYKAVTAVFTIAVIAASLGLLTLILLFFDGVNQNSAGIWLQITLWTALGAMVLVTLAPMLPDSVLGFEPQTSRTLLVIGLFGDALIASGLYVLLADNTVSTDVARTFLSVTFSIVLIVNFVFMVMAIQRD